MPRKQHTAEQIIAKLREAEDELSRRNGGIGGIWTRH